LVAADYGRTLRLLREALSRTAKGGEKQPPKGDDLRRRSIHRRKGFTEKGMTACDGKPTNRRSLRGPRTDKHALRIEY